MPAGLVDRLGRCTRSSARLGFAIVAGAVALLASAAPGGAGSPASGPVPGIGVFRYGDSYPHGSGYDRYAYVGVGPGDAASAGALNTTSLVYTSGTSVPTSWTAGVSYGQALANGWLLKDAGGKYVMNASYGRYVGDFGSPAYQQAFVSWALTFLAQNHDRGIEIDDTVCDAQGLTGGVYPAKYPNQKSWEDAQVSFVSTVGDALKARGYYVMVNATCFVRGNVGSNDGTLTAAFWRRLAPHVSGLCSEYWQQLPTDPSVLRLQGGDDWTHEWEGWQSLIDVAQNAGADFFTDMYGTSTSTGIMRYGKASFLLDWNGKGGAFRYLADDGNSDPWNAEWTMNVGLPVGPRYQVGVGWRRDFTAGTAILNPNQKASQQFSLGGTYFRADGTAVTSVTLAPGQALVLQSTGAGPAPSPPPPPPTPPPSPSPAPTQSTATAPHASGAPSIDGVARVGAALTATAGAWSGPPDSYAYQWQRCNAKGKRCTNVGTGTSTYVLTRSDKGSRLQVVVTAKNSAGAATATSGLTAVVAL